MDNVRVAPADARAVNGGYERPSSDAARLSLARLAKLAARVLDAPVAFLILADGARWIRCEGRQDGTWSSTAFDPLLDYLADPDAIHLVADATRPPVRNAAPSHADVVAWIGTELRDLNGGRLGVLGVGCLIARDWSAADQEIVGAFARAASAEAGLYAFAHQSEAQVGRSRFLADASALVSSLPDVAGLPARLARFCVPSVASVAIIQQLDGGRLTTVGIAHEDATAQTRLEAWLQAEPEVPDAASSAARALRTGEVVRERLALDDPLGYGLTSGSATRGPWHLAVPVRTGGRTIGVLIWVADNGLAYGEEDVALAREFSYRAALAWERAEVFAQRTHVAATLQRALLPTRLPALPGVQLATRYVAADAAVEVGGDFYDVFPAGDGEWIAIIGDVAGRGLEAADTTGLARHTLRAISRDTEPAEILRRLNAVLYESTEIDRFATVACARLRIDDDGIHVTLASGGHCAPVIVRADGDVELVTSIGWLIGGFPEIRVDEVERELNPGDALVYYTDGVIEARADQELFGEQRLLRVLAGAAGRSAEEIADRIVAAVDAFRTVDAHDDLAVLVLRRQTQTTGALTIPLDRGSHRRAGSRADGRARTRRRARQAPTVPAERGIPTFSVAGASRITGVDIADLAAWSDRYGLVVPTRTRDGAAVYSGRDLDALRFVTSRIDVGDDETTAHAALAELLVQDSPAVDRRPDLPVGRSVLLVDRDPYLLSMFSGALSSAGLRPWTARTVAQARDIVMDRTIATTVVDMVLAGESGLELCQELTSEGIPVVVCSSLRAASPAFAAGAHGFLTKPLDLELLVATVREVVTPARRTSSLNRTDGSPP